MLTRAFLRKGPSRPGAAAVEMALVMPIFVSVVLGIIEFGRAMMVAQIVTNSTREGARMAIVDGSTNAAVVTRVQSFVSDSAGCKSSDVSVTISITAAAGNTNPGNQLSAAHSQDLVTVTATVPFSKVSYLTGKFLQNKSLNGKTSMWHE